MFKSIVYYVGEGLLWVEICVLVEISLYVGISFYLGISVCVGECLCGVRGESVCDGLVKVSVC